MFWNRDKVLAIASPGGHWIQLNKICNPLESRHNIIYATPSTMYQKKGNKQKQSARKVFNILDAAADSKLRLIPLAFQLLFLIIKERPGTIISTGAAPGLIGILIARYIGIKTVWIDSIANVKSLSRSGRMIKSHAHIVLTQWEPLSQEPDKVSYHGAIL